MDLNDIVVFAKVIETRSFTAAADQLGIPKSTVSRRLAQLEERLGVRLVQRTTRKLSPTEIGLTYYERCTKIIADINDAEQVVTDMQAAPRGRLGITAPVDLSTHYLGPVIAEFLAKYPDIFVELDATDRVVDMIEEGFDVAIRFGSLPESSLIARRLCDIPGYLVASPAYLERRGTPTSHDDLDDHDRLVFTPVSHNTTWPLLDRDGNTVYEFGRPARFAANNVGAIHQAVLGGSGIAALSEFLVACDIRRGELVRVLPDLHVRTSEAHAVYVDRHNMPPRLQVFLDHLQRSFDPPPWLRQFAEHERRGANNR